MRSTTMRKTGLAAAAVAALIAVGVPFALAAPTVVPPSDSQGYVDSTARCSGSDTTVLFGSTETARVAICKTAAGAYEYRGVRVSDGARLIATASQTSGNTFVVNNDGVKYTITPTALSVTANGDTFRTETWTDFHGPQSAGSGSSTSPSTSATAKPSTSGSASPTTAAAQSSPSTASASPTASSSTPKSSAKPSSAAPLGPPLAAEVGGSASSSE